MLEPVEYVSHRLPFPLKPTLEDAHRMLFTKFANWQYEQEFRAWSGLVDEEDGLFYKDFDQTLRLTTVIAGARCLVSHNGLLEALKERARYVALIKGRAAFTKFHVVRNQRGFSD